MHTSAEVDRYAMLAPGERKEETEYSKGMREQSAIVDG